MLTTNMLSTHGLIVGGTVKARQEAIKEIQYGFDTIGVATMHQEAKSVPTLLQGFIDRLPDQLDETKPCFAVFCSDAKRLFGDEAEYEGFEIEEMLQRVLLKGVRVYFSSTKLVDFPDYVLDEFETKIDVSVVDDNLALVKEEYEAASKAAAEKAALAAQEKKAAAEQAKIEATQAKMEAAEAKKEAAALAKANAKAEKMTSAQKALARSASSAVTSVTRSISTNVVNSVLGGKNKSVKDITKQVSTTALSSFLRNIINETTKDLTKKK